MMLIKKGMHALYSLSRCLNASFAQHNTFIYIYLSSDNLSLEMLLRKKMQYLNSIPDSIIETFVQYLPSVRLVTCTSQPVSL